MCPGKSSSLLFTCCSFLSTARLKICNFPGFTAELGWFLSFLCVFLKPEKFVPVHALISFWAGANTGGKRNKAAEHSLSHGCAGPTGTPLHLGGSCHPEPELCTGLNLFYTHKWPQKWFPEHLFAQGSCPPLLNLVCSKWQGKYPLTSNVLPSPAADTPLSTWIWNRAFNSSPFSALLALWMGKSKGWLWKVQWHQHQPL